MTKKLSCHLRISKNLCFAALIFDKRILPYSPQGGNQMFRKALAPAGTYAPDFANDIDTPLNIRGVMYRCVVQW